MVSTKAATNRLVIGQLKTEEKSNEIAVKTRMIAFRFFKQFWMSFPPLADSLCRHDMTEISLRNIGIIDIQVLNQSLFKLLGGFKTGLLNNFLNPAVEALSHAVCLRFFRLDQAMLNAVLRAFLIEDMFSSRLPLARRTEAVSELFAMHL